MKTPEQVADNAIPYDGSRSHERAPFNYVEVRSLVIKGIEDDRTQRDEWEADGVTVTRYRGAYDGVPVVQLDTHELTGRIRVNLNDGPPLYDGDPEKDSVPSAVPAHALELIRARLAEDDAKQHVPLNILADLEQILGEAHDVDQRGGHAALRQLAREGVKRDINPSRILSSSPLDEMQWWQRYLHEHDRAWREALHEALDVTADEPAPNAT